MDTPLTTIKFQSGEERTVQSLPQIRAAQLIRIQNLFDAPESTRRDLFEKSSGEREAAFFGHNRKINVRPINFSEDDFLFCGTIVRKRDLKPAFRWRGQNRVTACRSEYFFEVEHLVSGKCFQNHDRRLKFFRNEDLEITEKVLSHLAFYENNLLIVERKEDIRRRDGVVESFFRWKGLSAEEGDWVPVSSLSEDVPALPIKYLAENKRLTPRDSEKLLNLSSAFCLSTWQKNRELM